MKAILVIDLPKDCWSCPLYQDEAWLLCPHMDDPLKNKRHDDCPLKQLPNLKDDGNGRILKEEDCSWTEFDYEVGYNACINEILGETNESNISDRQTENM